MVAIYRGGPMFGADTVGIKHIADRLLLAKETNETRARARAAAEEARAEGKTFASMGEAFERA